MERALTDDGWDVEWTRHEWPSGAETVITGDNPRRDGSSVWIWIGERGSGSEVQVSLDGGPEVSCFVARLLPG